ncbi:MAG TPA: hypothetical protein DEP05_10405 [Betaproteobacteria bacterium]|nr:hypothetical protein [Betaproteobacteria bacterium]
MRLAAVLFVVLTLFGASTAAATLTTSNGAKLFVRVSPAPGKLLLIWFPCFEGAGPSGPAILKGLARQGVETWVPNIADSLFLPATPESLNKIPDADIADIIAHAAATRKQVVVMAAGHAARNVLRGVRLWQRRQSSAAPQRLAGAILLYPHLYAGHPLPGSASPYAPIAHRTRLPIVILQPERDPGKWWIHRLEALLKNGGSRVETIALPGVRDAFYFRRDPTAAERRVTQRLPAILLNAMQVLHTLRETPHD